MRLGVIARGDDRGLGIQTWEAVRHLRPDRVLLVNMGDSRFPLYPSRYPMATMVHHRTGFLEPEEQVREFLGDVDVVYSAETFYDKRVPEWAEETGTGLALHVNPEFFKPDRDWSRVTTWWAPTSWRLDQLPADTRHVPMPAPLDRFPQPARLSRIGPLRVLHVVGHRAAMDRAGTTLLLQAVRYMRQRVDVTMTCQDPRLPAARSTKWVNVLRRGTVEDYWSLYADQDVLVLPRRYGGLSLPTIEAQAAGLPVVMPDASPQNTDWPAVLTVRSRTRGYAHLPTCQIPMVEADPHALAVAVDRLADPERRHEAAVASRAWAEANSWSALRGLWRSELERAAR